MFKNVGIVGCGIIGNVLKKWLLEHNPDVNILISDPQKGLNDNLSSADVIFISVHIPTKQDGTQDLDVLYEIIPTLPDKPIFIRTTVLPGTCDELSRKFNKKIYFMPEFLTERTAYLDFCAQPMIFTAETDLLKSIFKDKKYIEMTNIEAEITKYTHNVFGALKVTYFNCIYDLCANMEANYKKVQQGILVSGYINHHHTMVPGPDGQFGYGGKCFPKDVDAFVKMVENTHLHTLLKDLKHINREFRGNDN